MFIKYFFNLLVLIALFFTSLNSVCAADSILNSSVRKSGANGLNFTFYTNNENIEQPIVKDKGNNQYVILLPNLTDSSGRQPDLRAVSDIVDSLNFKTINEGAVTYTKVTLTTKVPANINVETKRTSQSTSDLSGVNDIVAKVNLINQDIQSTKNVAVASPQQAVVKNVSSVKDILDNKNNIGTVKPVVDVKKEATTKPVATAVVSTKSVSAHIPAGTKNIKKETKKLQDENIKNVRAESVKKIDTMEQVVKSSVENNVTINDDESQFENVDLEPLPLLPEMNLTDLDSGKKSLLSSGVLKLVLLGGLFFGLLALCISRLKFIKAKEDEFSESFIGRMNSFVSNEKKDYSHIAQNQNLTWQEKYNSYKTGKIQEQRSELTSYVGADVDEDLDFVDIETAEQNDDVYEYVNSEEQVNPFAASIDLLSRGIVLDSGDVIASDMRRSIKGFQDEKSLSKIQRNVGLKNRFSGFERDNTLGLQRNINELLDTVIKLDEEKHSSAIDEVILTNVDKVVSNIENAKQAREFVEQVKNASVPIQENVKQPERRKLKIRESRSIDENKGFYLVDMADKLALMGRINDKFTVLKKFDDLDKKLLQVRRDKDSLYMVRTEGFKALVDVNEDKMGVLAEL